ncbi:MAG: hypothetical protein JWP96_315 [Polaromonas sp.]|jgi:hypothetical protein|nr:hypothetical protein [Polaromonas sp.]
MPAQYQNHAVIESTGLRVAEALRLEKPVLNFIHQAYHQERSSLNNQRRKAEEKQRYG